MPPDSAAAAAALDFAHRQLLVALWVASGMVCAAAATVLLALGWRRCALWAGLGYGVTLCFIPVGHARVLGPLTLAAAAFGLLRPARRPSAPGGRAAPRPAAEGNRPSLRSLGEGGLPRP